MHVLVVLGRSVMCLYTLSINNIPFFFIIFFHFILSFLALLYTILHWRTWPATNYVSVKGCLQAKIHTYIYNAYFRTKLAPLNFKYSWSTPGAIGFTINW